MKNEVSVDLPPSSVPFKYRMFFHGSLVAEQLLGERAFRFFGGKFLRNLLLGKLSEKLKKLPPAKPIEVERRENIHPETFQEEYFRTGKPIVFSGAAKNWPCVKKWNLDFFSAGYGSQDLLLVNAEGLTSRSSQPGFEFLPLRKLVESIRQKGEKYLRFSPLLHENPDLAKDLDLDWLEKMRGGRTFASTYYMFLGGAGQKTLLHNDQPCNLYVQVFGEKKWTLFSAKDSTLLYPEVGGTAYVKSGVDLSNPDQKKHPLFPKAQPYIAHLKPGDILYVPPFFWHEVENLTETIAVGYRYSSLRAALFSSKSFLAIRALSMNPPIWKTHEYGKQDTNLIWAHASGIAEEVLAEREKRKTIRLETKSDS